MKIQTNQEFNQNEIEKLNKTYNVDTCSIIVTRNG